MTERSCNECTARGRKRCSDYLCGPTKKSGSVCVCVCVCVCSDKNCLRCHHSQQSHTMHTQTPTRPRPSVHVSKRALTVETHTVETHTHTHFLFLTFCQPSPQFFGSCGGTAPRGTVMRSRGEGAHSPRTLSAAPVSPVLAHFIE